MIVIDASVVIKLVAEEEGSFDAHRMIDLVDRLAAPALVFAEVANVLRRKTRLGEIEAAQAAAAVGLLGEMIEVVVPDRILVERAHKVSVDLDHSVYDGMYLAASLEVGVPLVTADEVFRKKCERSGFASVVTSVDGWLRRSPLDERQVAEIQRLSELADETVRAFLGAAGQIVDPSGRRLLGTLDFLESYRSIPHVRLVELLRSLSDEKLAFVVALGWFGREERISWETLRAHAHASLEVTRNDIDYVLPLLRYVPEGLRRLQREGVLEIDAPGDRD